MYMYNCISNLIVFISNTGSVIGKSRKNHIPRDDEANEVMTSPAQ